MGATTGICCCNTSQIETLIVLAVSISVTAALWHSVVFAPLKLIAVFLHEFSHASATWLTCGRVSGIEINENFGGVTYSRGGERWFILSAGYTGSVVWGCFFILMTWDQLPTRIAAVCFIIVALVTIFVLRIKEQASCYSRCFHGIMLRVAIIIVAAIPAALWVLEEYTNVNVQPLRWCMLAFGSVCTLHAVYDCLHDVLCHKIDNSAQGKSDAVMFAQELGGTARCWGFLWSTVSIVATALALFGVMMLTGRCTLINI